jgi:hypothetical protein
VTAIRDPRFDCLTPPIGLFKQKELKVILQFYDRSLAVVDGTGRTKSLSYGRYSLPLLEALETGVMSWDCVACLKKTIDCKFSEGCVLCKCVDNRFSPAREFTTKLEIGAEVVAYFSRNPGLESALEGERHMCRLRRPIVCTDPSPNVARVQSALDFRKKMWVTRKERTQVDVVAPEAPVEVARAVGRGLRIEQTVSMVEIPEAIMRLCGRRS